MIDYDRVDATARVTIRRPEKHNALTAALVEQMITAFRRAEVDDDVKVIVLASEGPTFCSGFDLTDRDAFDGAAGATRRARVVDVAEKAEWMRTLWTTRKPVIVAVQGACIGIGMYLVLVADFAVAAERATFGLPEERYGSAGATWAYPFLIREIGVKRATEMVMTGRRYEAVELQAMGLLTRVVPDTDLDGAVTDLASALCSLPRDGIAVSRAARELALTLTGRLDAFAFHAVAHPLTERLTREADEFDFVAAVERDGMKGALAARDREFGGRWWGW
jgi:enoyl-CoA hydratase/carnithine racemase